MKGADYCWWHSLGRFKHVPFYKNATFQFLLTIILTMSLFKYQSIMSKREAEKSSLSGILRSQETPLSKELIQVYFGTNCYAYPVEMLDNEKVIHPFSGVDIRLKGDEIKVSAKILSTDGKICAKLIDNEINNEWQQINYNNRFYRNYDLSALEVYDGTSDLVVLQVELLDRQSVRLSGLFEDAGMAVQISKRISLT